MKYKKVVVLTASSEYGSLGPYLLKDEQGRIMENIWQFSKIYGLVRRVSSRESRWSSQIVWEYGPHLQTDSNDRPTPEYFDWREKGMANPYPVRYPVGFSQAARASCKGAILDKDLREGVKVSDVSLGYVEARKQIYEPVYTELVKKEQQFRELVERRRNGENLLIIEVDGPHQESLDYYKQTYGVGDDFIVEDTMLATKENLDLMLNDERHAYGHGYVLARAILEEI